MKYEDEVIERLNEDVKVTLKPSPIHGIGVFAIRDIKQGEYLFTREKSQEFYHIPLERLREVRPEVRKLILDRYAQIESGQPFQNPNADAYLVCFINHSDNPNTESGEYSLRDIKAGEEITEDYRKIKDLAEIQKEHFSFLYD